MREIPVFAIRKMSFRLRKEDDRDCHQGRTFVSRILIMCIHPIPRDRPTPTPTLGPAKCKGFKVFTNLEFRIRI